MNASNFCVTRWCETFSYIFQLLIFIAHSSHLAEPFKIYESEVPNGFYGVRPSVPFFLLIRVCSFFILNVVIQIFSRDMSLLRKKILTVPYIDSEISYFIFSSKRWKSKHELYSRILRLKLRQKKLFILSLRLFHRLSGLSFI